MQRCHALKPSFANFTCETNPLCCDDVAFKPEAGALHSVQQAVTKPADNPLRSCTGVYVGCSYQDYTDVVLAVTAKLAPQAVVGSGASFMVGRLSYAFGLTGADRKPC
jgi:Beta-ketoacyl synthase, N-terminal domain